MCGVTNIILSKTQYLIQGPTNLRGPISPPTCGGPILSQSLWTCPPKLTPEGIEPETLRGAHSKIPSQPLGQPK